MSVVSDMFFWWHGLGPGNHPLDGFGSREGGPSMKYHVYQHQDNAVLQNSIISLINFSIKKDKRIRSSGYNLKQTHPQSAGIFLALAVTWLDGLASKSMLSRCNSTFAGADGQKTCRYLSKIN